MAKWNSLHQDVKKALDGLPHEYSERTGKYMDGHVQGALCWSNEKCFLEVIELPDASMAKIQPQTATPLEEWKAKAARTLGLGHPGRPEPSQGRA